MKLFKKKWFTLIEILLVIVIITTILVKLLSLSWTNIKELSFNNDNAVFLNHYNKLLSQKKTHKVAAIACMRKAIITLNAMLRDQTDWDDLRFSTDKKSYIKHTAAKENIKKAAWIFKKLNR